MFVSYVETLKKTLEDCEVTGSDGPCVGVSEAVEALGRKMRVTHDAGGKVIFIGNGGSAGINSHLATDYSKNGGVRSLAMNDASVLTCLGNDYGYEHVFEKQIEWHGREGDLLVAVSSSGASRNILNAVAAARAKGCYIATFSGFDSNNPLRETGDVNFYLPNMNYGFVEVGHLVLLHAVLDIQMGWTPAD